jgi:hypothetical protein
MCLFSSSFVSNTTIRKQTYIEVMDTKLYENKHIPKSWTHNYTKTNIYRSHGHTFIRKQTHIEVFCVHDFGICLFSYSRVSMTSICVCFRIMFCPWLLYVFVFVYRSHGHKTIRKQTYTEVMDTKLYENKHISKSRTHNYTKTTYSCVSMTSVYVFVFA